MDLHKYEIFLIRGGQSIKVKANSIHPYDASVAWVKSFDNTIEVAVYSHTVSRIDVITTSRDKTIWLMQSSNVTHIPEGGKCETIWTNPYPEED